MKNKKTILLSLLFTLLAIGTAHASTTTAYNATNTYLVPTGVTSLFVETWGAGGGGAGCTASTARGGGGGGGGAYSAGYLSVTPGQNWSVIVGTGGAGGAAGANSGNSGTSSEFNYTTTNITADGGKFGVHNGGAGGTGGTGGNSTNSTGTIIYSGGKGAAGGIGNTGSGWGGGGGGGAGSYQSGGAGTGTATNVSGGTGGNNYGGNAGDGRTADGNGNAGATIGAGGGGAYCDGSSVNAGGGKGAIGEVRVTEFTLNKVFINIYYETNGTLLTGNNITIQLTNTTYSTSTSTQSGIASIDALAEGNYTVSLTSGNFATRQYIVSVSNNGSTTLNAYLLNSTTSTVFIISGVYGTYGGQPIPNAILTWETIINNTFTTIESRETDISGTAGPFAYSTTSLYRITITANGYTTKQFTLNPVQYNSYTINLIAATQYTNPQDYAGISIVYTPSQYYDAQQNNFTYIISSPNGTLLFYNYTINYPSGTLQNNGSNSYGSTLTNNFNITGATIYSNVTINYCYNTTNTGQRCFTRNYPITITYSNYTLSAQTNNGLGDLEKIGISTVSTAAITGMVTAGAGPLAAGIVYLLSLAFFYKILHFSIWLLLIPGFIGFIIIAFGSRTP